MEATVVPLRPEEPWRHGDGAVITHLQGTSLSVPPADSVDIVVSQTVILAQRLLGNGPLATGRYRR